MKFENLLKQLMIGLEHSISREYTAESGEKDAGLDWLVVYTIHLKC